MPIDVRIITATHRELPALVADGRFREDLLYRINVIEVRVPPLRDRPDDLEPLIGHLPRQTRREAWQARLLGLREALAVLRQHRWPGNVRELENVIERALVLGSVRF